jgi:hypothetical protein
VEAGFCEHLSTALTGHACRAARTTDKKAVTDDGKGRDVAAAMAPADERQDGRSDEAYESVLIRTFLGRQDGQWNAIAVDYTVIGVGDSPGEAVNRMLEMWTDYVSLVVRDGGTLKDAKRPISRKFALELKLRSLLAVGKHLVSRAKASRDIEVFVPGRPASC